MKSGDEEIFQIAVKTTVSRLDKGTLTGLCVHPAEFLTRYLRLFSNFGPYSSDGDTHESAGIHRQLSLEELEREK